MRRLTLVVLLFAVGPVARAASPSSAWRKRLDAIRAGGRLPLIDLSSTFNDLILNPAALGRRLDDLDVALIAVSCELERREAGGVAEDWKACAAGAAVQRPDLFLPLPTGDLDRAPSMSPQGDGYALLAQMGEEFSHGAPASGPVRLWAFSFWTERARHNINLPLIRSVPPDGELASRLMALSERTGAVVQVIGEVDDRFLGPFEALLAAHPKAKVIWGRLGMVHGRAQAKSFSAEYISSLLDRHPNLYIDLSSKPSVDSVEVSPGIVLDYGEDGNLVGIDIDEASTKLEIKELILNKLPAAVTCVA